MFKLTETYKDFNGVERTEDFLFNFTEAEMADRELSVNGGLSEVLKKIVQAKDQPALVKIFKDFVLDAYGIKSDDGRRFIKNEKVREEFSQTQAYSNIYMKLARNDELAAEFINNVIPQNN